MKGSRFTEEQIIGILREQEAHKAEILRVVEALGVQAASLIKLADDLRELLSCSAGQNDGRTLIPKASGCYGAHHRRSPG
jgi:translation initiation factor 1 (eIF-1/SUI1)